ncbi:MAG: hypothetical protein IKB20_03695 [Clostridia bacterium]|nr:hypothetical protein [Clostridia bacterium]
MKKNAKRWIAGLLAGCMSFSMTACMGVVGESQSGSDSSAGQTATLTGYSYLAVDINPTVELVVDGETVVTVNAGNDDAAVLLSGENFENMSVEEALEKIVALAEELGYLTEENDDVKITVSADKEEIIKIIEEMAKKGAEKGSDKAKVNNVPRSGDEHKVKELQGEDAEKYAGLTPSKLRLIEAIMEYDDTMTYEIGATMKVHELADMLDDLSEQFEGLIGEEMEKLFQEKYEEAKLLAQNKMAAIYGEEYVAAWERFVALKKVAHELERTAKNAVISPEDMEKIFGLFEEEQQEVEEETSEESSEETSEEVPPHGGERPEEPDHGEKPEHNWGMQDFENYVDDHFHHHFDSDRREDMEDKIEEIFEAYDEDNYVLTAEDLTAIEEAWGEPVAVTTLGELEEFLEQEEDKLEQMREEAELTADQELMLGLSEEVLEGLRDTVLDLMKEEMEHAKDKFQGMKDDRRH